MTQAADHAPLPDNSEAIRAQSPLLTTRNFDFTETREIIMCVLLYIVLFCMHAIVSLVYWVYCKLTRSPWQN